MGFANMNNRGKRFEEALASASGKEIEWRGSVTTFSTTLIRVSGDVEGETEECKRVSYQDLTTEK